MKNQWENCKKFSNSTGYGKYLKNKLSKYYKKCHKTNCWNMKMFIE